MLRGVLSALFLCTFGTYVFPFGFCVFSSIYMSPLYICIYIVEYFLYFSLFFLFALYLYIYRAGAGLGGRWKCGRTGRHVKGAPN